jgi:3-phosphoshikimate 1-carboxyvinyltransferase
MADVPGVNHHYGPSITGTSVRFDAGGPLRGSLRPPADKSISHRAALIAAMGEGETTIEGYLDAADTQSTRIAMQLLGAEVTRIGTLDSERELRIQGVRLRGAGAKAIAAEGPPGPLRIDVGNAGTLLRLLPGWLAGQSEGAWELFGDESISRRPIDRIREPLARMGARVTCREDRFTPVTIEAASLHGIEYELPMASAQVKSCLLFAGLLAEGETRIVEPLPTRDHSERMLRAAGATIERDENAIVVQPADRLYPERFVVPADFSSAAFFIAAALLVPGSEVHLTDVGINSTRTGLLSILTRMGATIEVELMGEAGGEPIGKIVARTSELRGTEVGGAEIPLAIDELPLVALAACFAEGETTIRDAAELRRKESDRIATVAAALTALGAEVEASEDGMRIQGTGGLRGGAIYSHGDHRIAMLGAIAGLASREGVEVSGMDAAAVSYPGFEAALASLLRT